MASDTEGAGAWRGGMPARPPKYGWKPGAGTRPGGRTARYALGLAAVVTAAAFAYLMYLLALPPRPLFVAVAADPVADALRLDAPLDLLGWRSAQRFLAAAERWTPANRPAAVPTALPAADDDESLKAWLEPFRQAKSDPVVMYFGVHGGATQAGEPVLFAGRSKSVRISQLVRAIGTGPLRDRRVLVLLDPARFRPDPVHDYRPGAFAMALRGLDEQVKGYRNLVLISGADGPRGWESEELGVTAFAHAVIRAFDEPTGRADVQTAAELFRTVAQRLEGWTGNNRPAVQSPVLLPLDSVGDRRAAGVRLSVRPPEPAAWPVAAVPSDEDVKGLRSLWQQRDERLKKAPHPAAYTPRAWRRYQELLLRHEAAVRSGLPAVAGRLEAAVRAAAEELKPPYAAVFGADGTFPASFGQSLAFATVRDGVAAPDPSADLWKLASADAAALAAQAGDPTHRPAERHLAVMVNHFYRDVVTAGRPPDRWANAIALRVRADRAAFGLPAAGAARDAVISPRWAGPTAAFSERVRPRIWKGVLAADGHRRAAEDELFGPTPPTDAGNPAAGYDAAAQAAAADRFAFHVRDVTFAELPYLGRWAITADDRPAELTALWEKVHALDRKLAARDGPESVATDAQAVWDGVTRLQKRFQKAINEQPTAAVQTAWLPTEHLLATPHPSADERLTLLLASRRITHALHTNPNGDPPTNTTERKKTDPTDGDERHADALVQLFAAEVGLPTNSPAARVAAWYDKHAPLRENEPASRLAVAFVADAQPRDEPAAVAGRQAWADLFDAFANRAVEDHWWDEVPGRGGAPYYRRIADQYHADAARLRGAAEAVKTPSHDPLAVTTPNGGRPLGWTSERRRTIGFTLDVPATTPPGKAVVVPRLDPGPLQITSPTRGRSLVDLRSAPTSVSLELGSDSESETPSRVAARVSVYFRGQRPDAGRTIEVRRRPELVITDAGPPAATAAVAVRADPTQPLPPVVVLLDYSGSMKEALNGLRLDGPDDAWRDGASKFKLALDRLELVLAVLPKGTPLHVRLFSARGQPDAVAHPNPAVPGERAVVDWQGRDDAKLRDLMARLRRFEPAGTTPLIESIITAARSDFPEPTDGPKTLVVLTDGADDSGRVGVPQEVRDGLRAGLKNTLAATSVKLIVVQFALNAADQTVSKDLFADLPALDVPGEVVSADDAEALRRELTAAIWPKLVLTGGPPGGPGQYPAGGWPARPPHPRRAATPLDGSLDPDTLYWSPPLTAGVYAPRVAGYPDPPYSTRGLPHVGLAAGDFLSLSLTRSGTAFQLRRELQADAYGPPRKAYRRDGGWVLSVPSAGVEDARAAASYAAVTLLEQVPPHRRPTPRDDAENPVRHQLPGAAWWQVSPADAAPPAAPPVGWGDTRTVVSRLYEYPAPAWEVRTDGWPRQPRGDFEPATVRAWVADAPPPAVARFAATPGRTSVAENGLAYRVSVEPARFTGSDQPMACLVIRTEYGPGDPVQVRLTAPVYGVREEHRYYRKANGYTALFGPWPSDRGAAVNVEVIRIVDVTGDPATEIRLTPPAPDLGRRPDGYRPKPTRIGP